MSLTCTHLLAGAGPSEAGRGAGAAVEASHALAGVDLPLAGLTGVQLGALAGKPQGCLGDGAENA
jgi:hypothetical protein